MSLYLKRWLKLVLAVLALSFSFQLEEARANGNTHADGPPPVEGGGTVRRAPIRRPPQRRPAPARTDNAPAKKIEHQLPTSLELGVVLMEQGRYQQARLLLQKAVREERGNPYAWYWYAMAHEKIGQFQQAQFFYTRAFDLDPDLPLFSRVMSYPDDGYRKPLWDPLRPARIHQVKLETGGLAIVPPDAPEATIRQMAPQFEVGVAAHAPQVYMPPPPPLPQLTQQNAPVYVPPPPMQ